MIKTLSAIIVAALLATAGTFLPGFTPQVEAGVTTPSAVPVLATDAAATSCATQSWPNIEARCLRSSDTRQQVQNARLVTAPRQ